MLHLMLSISFFAYNLFLVTFFLWNNESAENIKFPDENITGKCEALFFINCFRLSCEVVNNQP